MDINLNKNTTAAISIAVKIIPAPEAITNDNMIIPINGINARISKVIINCPPLTLIILKL
ncbi:MAG: hypothetical protein KBT35_00465 [Firmicutes bacterium]|nr:hypothetical protein [Candidatus Colivicinus equi]